MKSGSSTDASSSAIAVPVGATIAALAIAESGGVFRAAWLTDAGERWASVRSHLLTDPSGNVVGTYGTLMEGKLTLTSVPGEGTCFSLALPLRMHACMKNRPCPQGRRKGPLCRGPATT